VRILLAHGASGNADSMRPHVDGLRRRGFDALAIDLPKRKAESAVPVYRAALPNDEDTSITLIGGHSYGGRVASLLAAEQPVAGLVLLSYPLHRPGHAEWESRISHWPLIHCPTLLLSGEADPFARLELLRQAVARLVNAELVTYPGVRHGLAPVLDEALDRIAAFAARLA
jgi:predicted alpha/beta-hydrolase family hydrolase